MKAVRTFTVVPALPQRLERLRDVAYNLRWAWDHDAIGLFLRLDQELWDTSGHNPVAMLGMVEQERLDLLLDDEGFLAHLDRVAASLDQYLSSAQSWFERHDGVEVRPLVAYFSAEFGVTECLAIFAGGLGILAGDHLKSASDLGVPLVGVGLLYQRGYVRQSLDTTGGQQEVLFLNDFYTLPITLERAPDGAALSVVIDLPGRSVQAQIWRADVGRVRLYLLDTNIDVNNAEDRDITGQLYDGGSEMRIRQEILLGVGGYRAIAALGLAPTIFHINEGHAAFLALERIRDLMVREQLSFGEARELAASGTVFTTHTPVAAGHDRFGPELMEHYFGDYRQRLGLGRSEFLGLGRENIHDDGEPFTMTILAMRMSAHSNAVSELHGDVTRRMWQSVWPKLPVGELPIDHITNGVHLPSWISADMAGLYDRYLGPRWRQEPTDRALWRQIQHVPDAALWNTHERRRERLVEYVRDRLRGSLQMHGARPSAIEAIETVLDPNILTIGFARRFAAYKRVTLLLRDPDRLERILNNPERPMQVIFAGKAHPRDEEGKELIRHTVELSREERFRRRLVFVEDYDMTLARSLVQGADVWLNNPRRPLEASGTSGMKAAANGVINVSTLDGWWDEAWRLADELGAPIGWSIGRGTSYQDPAYADRIEAEALYELLENDVAPTFYERGSAQIPHRWVARMKSSIQQLCNQFNTHRMVWEYTERFYLPGNAHYLALAGDDARGARRLAAWRQHVSQNWGHIYVTGVETDGVHELAVGEPIPALARVHLGELTPQDVAVQLYYGRVDPQGALLDPVAGVMSAERQDGQGWWTFRGDHAVPSGSGKWGYTIRVLPHDDDLVPPYLPGLVTWESQ